MVPDGNGSAPAAALGPIFAFPAFGVMVHEVLDREADDLHVERIVIEDIL